MENSGARCRREVIEARRTSGSIPSPSTITLQVCPATVSFSSPRTLKSSADRRRTTLPLGGSGAARLPALVGISRRHYRAPIADDNRIAVRPDAATAPGAVERSAPESILDQRG